MFLGEWKIAMSQSKYSDVPFSQFYFSMWKWFNISLLDLFNISFQCGNSLFNISQKEDFML